MQLSRWVEFSSAHFYNQKNWSEQKNREEFGACYTPYGHGHNYRLEILLEGKIDSESGIVVNLIETESYLKQLVQPLDHHHLNFDVDPFKDLVPTTENIALFLWRQIKRDFAKKPYQVLLIRLFEAENLWVEIK